MPSVACAPPGPIEGVSRHLPSEEKTSKAAVEASTVFIYGRLKLMLLADPKLKFAEAWDAFIRLYGTSGCTVAELPPAKFISPKNHSQYADVYWGRVSTPKWTLS